MIIRTPYSEPRKGQTFTQPSETISGQAMSIKQMLERQQNGIPIPGILHEYGEDDIPQIRIKDLTDLDDIQTSIAEIEQRLQANKADQKPAPKD